MKNKNVFMISSVIMIILIICMVINWFIAPLSDVIVRVIGVLMIIDLIMLIYSTVKLKSNSK